MKQVLFVSHCAGRSGAPVVLLNHLQGLKKSYPNFEFDIILKKGGELTEDFKKVAETYVIPQNTLLRRIKNKIFKQKIYYFNFLKHILKNNYKIIYGNTVDSISVLIDSKVINPNLVTICHLHELEMAIKQLYGEERLRFAIQYIDYFVANSDLLKRYLTEHFEISPGKISVYHEHTPLPKNIYHKSGSNCLRIFGSGTMDWRKGIDVFIQVAYQLNKLSPTALFEFCWIGGHKQSIDHEKVIHDIKNLEIQHRVTLIDSCTNPLDYLAEADLFLLTSREDPFPLIALEAAALGKPIMCFKNAGGMAEFVNEKNGWLVDYLDIPQLVGTLNEILHSDNLKKELKVKGELSRVKACGYDIENGVEKWKEYLDEICSIQL